jgi:hypothetical protein
MASHITFATSSLLALVLAGTALADRPLNPQMLQSEGPGFSRRPLLVPRDYTTIQEAIDAAAEGQVVIVSDGIYTGPGNVDLDFGGKSLTLKSRGGASNCIIDCDGTPDDPHRGFNFHSGETADAIVDGFTIMNGSTPQGAIADQFNGAGILCTEGSSPTVRNCIIRDNWAGCWGAAVCCSFGSSPTISNTMIVNNFADDDGGAVFAWSESHPVIINSIIANNEANVVGGGIATFGGGMEVINSVIANNHAGFGSGVYGWNATLINSVVWNNSGAAQIDGSPQVEYSLVEGGFEGPGNFDDDPMFVDPDNGDFHLLPESPLVDAGSPFFKPPAGAVDIDGQPRLMNGRVDIGPDEVIP